MTRARGGRGKHKGRPFAREPYKVYSPPFPTDEQRMLEQQWADSELHRKEVSRGKLTDDPAPPSSVLALPLPLPSRAPYGQDPPKGPAKGPSGTGSSRFVPPVDTSRRDSRPPPEPSPRERGMIDPRVGLSSTTTISANPPRRSSLISWTPDKPDSLRDRERETPVSAQSAPASGWDGASSATSTSRRFSYDKITAEHASAEQQPPPQQQPRSPQRRTSSISASVAQSPLSLAGPMFSQPPTPTMNTATNPAALFPKPQFSIPPPDKDVRNVELSRLFLEASYAYFKAQEAKKAFHHANEERKHHEEHFKMFPAMRDKHDSQLTKAKKDKEKAIEEWTVKNEPFERYIAIITHDSLTYHDAEAALDTARQLARDLGNNSLEQYVMSLVRKQVSSPVKDELDELRAELREVKRKQSAEENLRQINANDFLNFKNDQTSILRQYESRLERFDEEQMGLKEHVMRLQEDHHKLADELKRNLRNFGERLREMQGETYGKLTKSPAELKHSSPSPVGHVSMHATPGADGLLNRIENLQQRISKHDDEFSQVKARMALVSDEVSRVKTEALHRINSLERERPPSRDMKMEQPSGSGVDIHGLQDYATANDILRLENLIKNNDEVIDTAREVFRSDTNSILEELQRQEDKTNYNVKALTTAMEELKVNHDNLEKNFTRHFGRLHAKFMSDMEGMQSKVDAFVGGLEDVSAGVRHVDARMNSFTTKDIQQVVVNELRRFNPALLDQGVAINTLDSEFKKIGNAVQALLHRVNQEHPNRPPPPLAITGSMNGFPVPSAIIPSNAMQIQPQTNGQPNQVRMLLDKLHKDIRSLHEEMQAIDSRLNDHIETYNMKMNNIREWTISATLRLGENTTSATIIMEEIKELRAFLNTVHSGSRSPPTGGDQLRALVAHQQNPIPSLSNDNATSASGNG
ncbi:hypothetical protein RUND412_006337 [Rhizina undulata]